MVGNIHVYKIIGWETAGEVATSEISAAIGTQQGREDSFVEGPNEKLHVFC
jgi:hypothetical protein